MESDLKHLYSKYLSTQSRQMENNDVIKLKECIRDGRMSEIRGLLESASPKEIRVIEEKFVSSSEQPTDPVNYAIDQGKEKVAIYLLEKGFPLYHVYWEDRAVCDEWCRKDHGPDKCPRQYDCVQNAENRGMEALKLRIDAVREGKSKPGDGISEPFVDKYMPHTPPPKQTRPMYDKDDQNRFVPEKKEKSHADEAREIVAKYGVKYCNKKGETLLHKYVDKPRVYMYVFANHGVPINVQNTNGDTALHLAVRKGRADVVEALVQCSADLSLRNRMGQTPVDEAEGEIKSFLRIFECGVILAVRDSHFNQLLRQVKRSWCNVHTKVKDDKSLLEWTMEKADVGMLSLSPEMKVCSKNELKTQADIARNSYRVLCDCRPTSELIHAVLCEDVELAQQVLWANKDLKVNIRFRDRKGKTLLSHAIETNNYEMVKLLVVNGANVAQVRVRENEQTDVTVPLYQKALRRDLDVNIVKLLQTVLTDSTEHQEKDVNGNTPLLRAIENGVDTQTIHWLIKARRGYSLMDRNCDGFTPREIAFKRGRDNVVKMIDRYIAKELPPIVLRLFPVAFYPSELLNIVDEEYIQQMTGDSLEQKLTKVAKEHHVSTWIDVNQTQNNAIALFEAAATGDVKKVFQYNNANYQDKNGFTALTRAIVFNQFDAARELCTRRPALRKIGDNCNRYPLHYAYALPKEQGEQFIKVILEKDANEIENRVDKDGRVAADYAELRETKEIKQMLYDARTLDLFGKRGRPLGPWPKGADHIPPTEQ
ncbi:uncharacterized protein LOC132752936 isoform X2 [Ruditapes philippinarum]|uniref:uncharacterized protein LOC132752936 isoform X2 n=2 Tax=Ruditapes philippinarum TaxID=129788 RepID=UPI00295BA352|nr:uncharacterized protein LOC132752936 isoform X2 [Ruditapes philippinarum]